MLNSYAGVIINTGEDNYLTTSDAYEKAYTVLASQLLNERFGFRAGIVITSYSIHYTKLYDHHRWRRRRHRRG